MSALPATPLSDEFQFSAPCLHLYVADFRILPDNRIKPIQCFLIFRNNSNGKMNCEICSQKLWFRKDYLRFVRFHHAIDRTRLYLRSPFLYWNIKYLFRILKDLKRYPIILNTPKCVFTYMA